MFHTTTEAIVILYACFTKCVYVFKLGTGKFKIIVWMLKVTLAFNLFLMPSLVPLITGL